MLAKIMQFSRKAGEIAAENGVTLPPEVARLTQLADTLTDRMIEGGNRLYGIPRDMTQEEHDAYSDLKLVALYSDKPAKERLSLLETLWDYPAGRSGRQDRISGKSHRTDPRRSPPLSGRDTYQPGIWRRSAPRSASWRRKAKRHGNSR